MLHRPNNLRIPAPRPRASFAEWIRLMYKEHGETLHQDWQLLDGGRWRVAVTCRECGSFAMTLSDADMATLNERAPGWFPDESRGGPLKLRQPGSRSSGTYRTGTAKLAGARSASAQQQQRPRSPAAPADAPRSQCGH